MDTFVHQRIKNRRLDASGQRTASARTLASQGPRRHDWHTGSSPTTALPVAENAGEAVSTFLPSSWHTRMTEAPPLPPNAVREGTTNAGIWSGFYNPALAPAGGSRGHGHHEDHRSHLLLPAHREPTAAFFNPALVPQSTASPVSSWPPLPCATAPSCAVPFDDTPTTANVITGATPRTPDIAVAPPFSPSAAAPGLHARASTRAVRGQDSQLLPPILQCTTLWRPETHAATARSSSADSTKKELGEDSFSVVVLDFETTGFSAAHEHIVEVGAVELRWTGRSSRTHHGQDDNDDSDGAETTCHQTGRTGRNVPAGGEWRFGARSFHRYVDPGKTDGPWWRRRQLRDARARGAHGSPHRSITSAESVHALTPVFLHEHGVSWCAAADALVAFCARLQRHSPLSDTDESDAEDGGVDFHANKEAQDVGRDSALPDASDSPSGEKLTAVYLPPFVAHRAVFDAAFLEEHLRRAGFRVVWHAQAPTTCTMKLCKALYPQQPANLDAACQFFGIEEIQERSRHGALLDATLCAQLFLRLERRIREQLTVPE